MWANLQPTVSACVCFRFVGSDFSLRDHREPSDSHRDWRPPVLPTFRTTTELDPHEVHRDGPEEGKDEPNQDYASVPCDQRYNSGEQQDEQREQGECPFHGSSRVKGAFHLRALNLIVHLFSWSNVSL